MISNPASFSDASLSVQFRNGIPYAGSWGSVTIGAPVVTKGRIILIGGSMDSKVRMQRRVTCGGGPGGCAGRRDAGRLYL
jgi:hypothetical protein